MYGSAYARRCACVGLLIAAWAAGAQAQQPETPVVAKSFVRTAQRGPERLDPAAWYPWKAGFTREEGIFVCEAGDDAVTERGASQTVVLNQERPEPIVASAFSKAEGVTGAPDTGYAVYVDLQYADGTPLYGQTAAFATGTHDWQRAEVMIIPERPVRQLTLHLLFRGHGGTARFREASLRVIPTPGGATTFDGVPVVPRGPAVEGVQVRDVAAGGDFVRLEREALGLKLDQHDTTGDQATFLDVTLRDMTGRDRALTLVYAVPVPAEGATWLGQPDAAVAAEPGRDHVHASLFRAGSSGRLSYYPIGAVEQAGTGAALGIDMARPAFFRVGYHAGTGELYLACDLALTPERPSVRLRIVKYGFDPAWGFRAAWDRYMRLFPEAFVRRVEQQGLWMPFAPISMVPAWEDFGFAFKEGDDETAWDDAHGILTFRYTEPLTWWMPMPHDMPRTPDAALGEAKRLAGEGREAARALLTSGYEAADGTVPAQILDRPWNSGAVWSMNSMPGIAGAVTDFKTKWSPAIAERLYGPGRAADLDGEYVDSSEGYVTDLLDYRRDHFAAADTPLVFDPATFRPAIFRGLIAFEYVRGIERDIHARGRLMMANATPIQLCFLAPLLDVLGTETDWNHAGRWQPMSAADLVYRRALCGTKPFCFLMNTEFDRFGPERVERYFKRSLAFGMFPGFFSADASTGHYFSRPELYERDRPLFRKYVPLVRTVAEAGWQPITRARCDDRGILLERFGAGSTQYLTVYNDGDTPRDATIRLDGSAVPRRCRELLSGGEVMWKEGRTTLALGPGDVAVLELGEVRDGR